MDPLEAISMRIHKKQDNLYKKPERRVSRHFSPLEAMNGKIVVKEKVADKKPNRKARLQRKNTFVKKRVSKISKVAITPKQSNTIEYVIENAEEIDAAPSATDTITNKTKTVQQKTDINHIIVDGDIGSESPNGDIVKSLLESQQYPSNDTEYSETNTKKSNLSADKEKILYLTFDDGPCGGTANVLQVMKEEGINATMFYIGRNALNRPKLFHRALSMPNLLIANHTFSHANGHYRRFYNSPVRNVINDIDRAQQIIGGAKYLRLSGRNVWRLPHIKRNDHGIKSAQRNREVPKYDALASRGYYTYGWDLEWHFSYKNQHPLFGGEEMARRVNLIYNSGHLIKKGKVVLLAHDFMWRSRKSVEELRVFLRIMKAQGWKFETIDNYINVTPSVFVKKNTSDKINKKLKKSQMLAQQAKLIDQSPQKILPKKNRMNKTQMLIEAIRNQDFLKIRKLLAQGADLNAKDLNGDIPLNIAIKTNNAVLVKMLVERGANVFNIDANGMSPMGIAKQHHNSIIIKYLKHQIDLQKKRKLKHIFFAQR